MSEVLIVLIIFIDYLFLLNAVLNHFKGSLANSIMSNSVKKLLGKNEIFSFIMVVYGIILEKIS